MSTSSKQQKANATDICRKPMIDSFINLKRFLDNLLRNIEITKTNVGKTFNYPNGIVKNKLFSNYGIFMDYFIRKHLSNQYQIDLNDDAVELVLKRPEIYFTGNKKRIQNDILQHYKIFKDPATKAMDIVKSIKIVSLAYTLTFHDPLPKAEVDSDDAMLLEIIKYFKSLPFKRVEMKTVVDCEYFKGNADLIFNGREGEVLYEIKTSQYVTLRRNDVNFSKQNFYKLILYGFGYYKKTGKIIKTFRIYNPLLGCEHQIVINNIDFKEFERCLEEDTLNLKLNAMYINK
ncbi:hypothetical protein DOY81_011684 [Sarcophaga bullata]|nr:hypothetical protein DOY81_011684 [Sarcophaga bullata]